MRAGKRHLLSEFKGRYVLLNLWATLVQPCVRELPALAGLQAAVPPDAPQDRGRQCRPLQREGDGRVPQGA